MKTFIKLSEEELTFRSIELWVKTVNDFPFGIQAFLDFRGFNFRDFRFNAVYNSILKGVSPTVAEAINHITKI